MNLKQMISLGVCGLGVFMVGYGLYSRMHISAARHEVHKLSGSKNPVVKSVGKKVEDVIGDYTHKVKFCVGVGIVLILAGAGGVYYFREHRKWW